MIMEKIELYKRYRPVSFKQIVGQGSLVRSLVDLWKRGAMPHTILFSGPSGCGKTTLARILRKKLKCSEVDFREMNLADLRGIDEVRKIQQRVQLAPMGGGETRIWLLDEAHKLTSDAQHAFLKLLEDTPSHVYFILCTTEPQKLLKTIRNRCTEFQVKALGDADMTALLGGVATKEGVELSEAVTEKLVEVSEGSPRKALVLLHQVIGEADEENQLRAIEEGDSRREAIELARALLNPKPSWGDVAAILKGIDDLKGGAEGLRRLVLAYCCSVLLGGGRSVDRASFIMDRFQDNFFDSGEAGLVLACYDVTAGRRL